MRNAGISNVALFITIAVVGALLFFIAPKFLNSTKSSRPPAKSQAQETTAPKQESHTYVKSYNKGMAGAQAAVDASRDRSAY